MNDNFLSLKVKLTTNFSQLSTVRVITNNMADELRALRRGENGEDTTAVDNGKKGGKP